MCKKTVKGDKKKKYSDRKLNNKIFQMIRDNEVFSEDKITKEISRLQKDTICDTVDTAEQIRLKEILLL